MRCTLGICLLLLSGPGCVSAPRPTAVGTSGPECAISRAPAPPPQALVFTADGIGGYGATTTALRQIAEESSLPLFVQAVPWSHGYGRVLADHVDYRHTREEGRKLAARDRLLSAAPAAGAAAARLPAGSQRRQRRGAGGDRVPAAQLP